MHKTDLIWGGAHGGAQQIFGGACAPPGTPPPLGTPLGILYRDVFSIFPKFGGLYLTFSLSKTKAMS